MLSCTVHNFKYVYVLWCSRPVWILLYYFWNLHVKHFHFGRKLSNNIVLCFIERYKYVWCMQKYTIIMTISDTMWTSCDLYIIWLDINIQFYNSRHMITVLGNLKLCFMKNNLLFACIMLSVILSIFSASSGRQYSTNNIR